MGWRDEPITEKQKTFISQIEEDAGINGAYVPSFNGNTKGEACDWIAKFNGKQYYSLYNPHDNAGDRV